MVATDIPSKISRVGRRVQDVPAGGARAITLRAVVAHKRALLGAILTLIVLGIAVLGVFWTPYDPVAFDAGEPFSPPSWGHPMGTDIYGRDILSRVMAGSRVSLLVAAGAVAGATVVGTTL